MTDPRKPAFDGVRAVCEKNPFNDPGNVHAFHNLLDAFGARRETPPPIGHNGPPPEDGLTPRIVLEILEHEGIVLEAYRDSKKVLTWGVGVTSASGHRVDRYVGKPQSMERVLEIYLWLLRTKYLPAVRAAFAGIDLAEHELGAALSFHWNTGAIGRAEWVQSFVAGNRAAAHRQFMNWSSPRAIIGRRKAERALFFDGVWTGDGFVTVYKRVRKPSLVPDWGSAVQVDVREALVKAMEED